MRQRGTTSSAHTRAELLTYLRDSFTALKKSLNEITVKNMFDPMRGPYATPNTRLGLADICVWHNADHFGQMAIYLRLNNIVPPAAGIPGPSCRKSISERERKSISDHQHEPQSVS